MKGRICNHCESLTPYEEPYCRKCGNFLEYMKIEYAIECDNSEFPPNKKRTYKFEVKFPDQSIKINNLRLFIERTVTGAKHWKPWERAIWSMSVIGSALWISYIIFFDVFLFKPKAHMEYEKNYVSRSFNNFNDQLMDTLRQINGECNSNIAIFEGRQTRNKIRESINSEIKEYNDNYLIRGFSRAFGIPVAWFGILLTFITFVNKFENDALIENEKK